MGFLGIGAMEAIVIMVIALIIFGPGRLPEIMGEAGRTLRDFRRATRDLTGDFEDSISEVRGTYSELESEMRDAATGLQRDAQGMADELNTAVADVQKLDGDASTRPPRRQSQKLDQMVEPAAGASANVAQNVPPSRDQANAPQSSEKAAARSPNGSAGSIDDLLSADDGDDLLSVDESR